MGSTRFLHGFYMGSTHGFYMVSTRFLHGRPILMTLSEDGQYFPSK